MAADLKVVPDVEATGCVAVLRRELAHHSVHRWAATGADRTTLLGHIVFSHWAGAMLASSLDVDGPARQFVDTCRALRRRGAGACIAGFAAGVSAGADPVTALFDAGGPTSARPLVEVTARLLAGGRRDAQAGALFLGLPGSVCEGSGAPGDLAAPHEDPGAERRRVRPPAEDAATAVLVAQLTLLDGALHLIRHRHMAAHPAMWGRTPEAPPRLRLLSAS